MNPEPLIVDDFREFLDASYRPLLAVLAQQNLTVTIEAGAIGHYLLVVQPTRLPQVGVPQSVEVTADDNPLPANPADITTWTLTTTHRTTRVANTTPDSLARALTACLRP
jgi:hypothetical protein